MQIRKQAKARFLRIGERKLRQVATELRGMSAEVALDKLNFLPKRKIAVTIAKTLKSAVANALEADMGGHHLRPEDLTISYIAVDGGPIARRYEFRAMGRVNRIQRRFSHLTIEVTGTAQEVERGGRRRGKAQSADADTGADMTTEKATAKKKTAARKKTAKSSTKKTGKGASRSTGKKSAVRSTRTSTAKRSTQKKSGE